VDAADAEGPAFAGTMPASVQPFDDFLDAEGAGLAISIQVEGEDEPNRLGFHRIDVELLLDLRPALLRLDHPVAERRRCPVPEPLPGVFLHRPEHMLGILL
jgi:hypothetical protein